MHDKAWYTFYVLLFFSILIPTTVFLFHGNNSKIFNHRAAVLVMEPGYKVHIQTLDPNNPSDCMQNLVNRLESGNLDLKALQDGLDKCFGLKLNDNDGNNIPVVPQPPSGSPQFV